MQPRLTLRPTDRLKKRADYLRVQHEGRKHHTKHFLVVVLARGDAESTPRIGITVTKKVGNAVARNRVKRVVREVFRRERARFPQGCDVVFIAKEGAPLLGYDEVLAELPQRWQLARAPQDKGRPSHARPSPQGSRSVQADAVRPDKVAPGPHPEASPPRGRPRPEQS